MSLRSKAPTPPHHLLFHFLFLKRYATANNPAIADTTSNPGTLSSGVGISVAVVIGDGVEVGVGVDVRGTGVTVGVGEGVISLIFVMAILIGNIPYTYIKLPVPTSM